MLVALILTCTAQAREWKVVTHWNYPPYNFVNAQQEADGLDTRLVKAVLAHLDLAHTVEFIPWKRVVNMVEKNEVDLAFQFKSTPERRKKYLLIGPLRSGKTVFAVRRDSDIRNYDSLEDLKPYTIGTNLGYSYGHEFDAAAYLTKDNGAKTNGQLIDKLLSRRFDIMIGDYHTLVYFMEKKGVRHHIRFLPKIYKEFPRYVAIPRERPENAGLFDHGLNAIRENGIYGEIMKAWETQGK